MRQVLRRSRELGIDLIDTADSYGPEVSEELIAEVLHPYRRSQRSRPRAGSSGAVPTSGRPTASPVIYAPPAKAR